MADCQLSDLFFERLQFTLLPPIPPQAASESEGGREAGRRGSVSERERWFGLAWIVDEASVKSLITRARERECFVLKGTNYESA